MCMYARKTAVLQTKSSSDDFEVTHGLEVPYDNVVLLQVIFLEGKMNVQPHRITLLLYFNFPANVNECIKDLN